MLNLSPAVRTELARALRDSHYEMAPAGVLFPRAGLLLGGVFGCRIDDGPMHYGPNAVANEGINAMLDVFFHAGAQTTAWFIAPFTTNVAPTAALTAAAFAATQGEYTAYTEAARQAWTVDAAPTAQIIQNSVAPAVFTIGVAAATICGAGLLSASAKGATTGTLAAAGLFGVSNTLNPGSKLTVTYQLTGTST